ncbi:hypothetical protein MIR68_006661 [Amoeboaphelidium protococcarum]|nr:hypothetical protein MIR68_006661 [Amoeboaphelidium protococcarum]
MNQGSFNYCPIDGHLYTPIESVCPQCQTSRYISEFTKASSQQHGKKKWRKLLYIKQDYPDNYVDHTFLEQMQKNANLKTQDYWTIVSQSWSITSQLSSIVIFVCTFVFLFDNNISIEALITRNLIGSVICYMFWIWSINRYVKMAKPHHSVCKVLKASVLFFIILIALSPILKTLTQDTSDDTIYALSTIVFTMNLLFHDYTSVEPGATRYPGALSLNAAIFGSVLLASRLSSSLNVFGLMLFAVTWFGLLPIFRRSMVVYSKGSLMLNLLLLACGTYMLHQVSTIMVHLYLTMYAFITFVCPFWLIWIQRYKNEIKGSWDEMKLMISEE